jgi:hypothetical protein
MFNLGAVIRGITISNVFFMRYHLLLRIFCRDERLITAHPRGPVALNM